MADNTLQDNYLKFVSNLTATIRKLSLYPSKHPTVVYSIKNLYSMLQEILNKKEGLSISLSSDGQILIEGQSAGDRGLKLTKDLTAYFKKLDIESLTFSSGITDTELEAFIRCLFMDAQEISKSGGLNKLFSDKGIRHVKIAQFSYVKIERGKVAVGIDKEKQRLLDKLKSKIKDYSLGKIQEPAEVKNLEGEIIKGVVDEFKEQGKLSTGTKNIIKKFTLKSKDKKDFLGRLSDGLLNSGCPKEAVDKLVGDIRKGAGAAGKTGARAKAGAGAGGTGVKEARVGELRQENQELKSRVRQLEEEADSKAAAYEVLEKEKRRAVQEKERIDNIVRHIAEGLVVVDAKGNIVMLNPVAEQLLGVSKKDIGMSLSKTIKDEHLLSLVKNIMPDKEGGIKKDIELLGPDESTKKVLRTSSAVVEDYNGKTVGMVTILNDITRQKELEKMKSDFVANVSHELRTPLAAIQQNISLLTEGLPGALNETQTKFLNITQDNIKRLKRLINDLLDSAAIEAGKFKLHLSPADVNERINNVVAFLSRWIQTKNISVQTDLLPENESLEMDKDRIEQLLINLLSNAIKFTPEGGKIFISAAKREPSADIPQGAIEISVRDTGSGIAPEDVKRIFEKFERATVVSSGIGGTGLGLSISKEIIKMHGGKIWVESKPSQGSKFSFLLPCGAGKKEPERKNGG